MRSLSAPYPRGIMAAVIGGSAALLAAPNPARTAQSGPSGPAAPPGVPGTTARLPPGFDRRYIDVGEGFPRQYVIFVPPAYRPDRKWPLLVFMHGSGECGTNDLRHTSLGLAPYIAFHRLNDFPFITLFPQVPKMWFRGEQEAWVWAMIEATSKEFSIDHDRLYLTGMSMGGFGAWELAIHHPDRVAAIAPVCGGIYQPDAEALVNILGVPVWAFHGQRDEVVTVSISRSIINALRQAGGKPRYTEYPEVGHDSWTRAYATPDLYKWLLQQKRRDKPKKFSYVMPTGNITLPWTVWWFRFDGVPGGRDRPRIACEVRPDGQIHILTRGVVAATLLADRMPVKRGEEVTVVWNERTLFKGKFGQDLSWIDPNYKPRAAQPGATSQPIAPSAPPGSTPPPQTPGSPPDALRREGG